MHLKVLIVLRLISSILAVNVSSRCNLFYEVLFRRLFYARLAFVLSKQLLFNRFVFTELSIAYSHLTRCIPISV